MTYRSLNTCRGITLIELVVALAIAAVLFGFAVNAMGSTLNSAQTRDAGTRLLASLASARSAALERGGDVVLCPSADGIACADSYHWEGGWIAFTDKDRNGERDDNETVLQVESALADPVRLVTSTGRTRLHFQADGAATGSNATFTLCDTSGHGKPMAYAMANSGNVRAVPAKTKTAAEICGA